MSFILPLQTVDDKLTVEDEYIEHFGSKYLLFVTFYVSPI